jgi:hypothetical protein
MMPALEANCHAPGTVEEILALAREAARLEGVTDPDALAAFHERKAALLARLEPSSTRIGILNSAMYGMVTEPGEHVAWDMPDYLTAEEWADLLGESVESYAAHSPHMIVFEEARP